MKTLFYNSIELPAEVHIVSECFGIDITYEPMGDPDHPAWMSELFNLAKCDSFEEVAVRLTKHNEGYTRKSKFAEREEGILVDMRRRIPSLLPQTTDVEFRTSAKSIFVHHLHH